MVKKPNGQTIFWLIAGFVWSIFMGVTAISIGFGSAIPSLNAVAGPFVCPNGQMTAQQETSNPLPGTTYTSVTWYCIDNQTGKETELDLFQVALPAGVIYGILLFAIIILIWYLYKRRSKSSAQGDSPIDSPPQSDYVASTRSAYQPTEPVLPSAAEDRRERKAAAVRAKVRQDAEARLKELKSLHTSKLISDTEYAQKRAEIIKDL